MCKYGIFLKQQYCKLQIYSPDYSAFSLAVDTAGLLLRIDQVVRSTPLIHPTQPTDNTANNPTNTQPHAYRGLRPEAFTKDPSVERREMEQRRKANKKFYGQVCFLLIAQKKNH